MKKSESLLAVVSILALSSAPLGVVPGLAGCSGGNSASGDGGQGRPGATGPEDGGQSIAPGGEDGGTTPTKGGTGTDDGGGAPAQGTHDGGGAAHPHDAGPSPDASSSGGDVDSGDSEHDAAPAPDASSATPGKLVGGYYPNWTPSPVRIRDVDPHYNLIYLFAATPVGGTPGTTGAIEWTPPGDGLGAATNLNADIAYARASQGRKIVMSVGGAGNAISFPARTKSQAFVDSVEALYTQLGGFDGIDWDTYEGSDSPDTSEMIWISLQLKSKYPGFLITTPPAPWSTVDQTFCAQMAAAGALDWAAPQYYDGPNLATQAYIVPSIDTWAKLLGEDKMVVGFGISTAANYMTVAQVISTWNVVNTNHPSLRGAFDWEIDVDQASGWPFADQVGPLIDP